MKASITMRACPSDARRLDAACVPRRFRSPPPFRSYAPFLLSWEAIPSGTTSAILKDHVFLYEISEMILKRVPTRAGYLDHIPHGDAAMVTGIIQNRDGQLGHCCQGDLLSLNLEGKSAHLLL